MTKFLLIRHGMCHPVGKRLVGRTAGVHLNEEGKLQVQNLGESLSAMPIAAVYSSPMERATETAEAIARPHRLATIVNHDFDEMEFGQWTNAAFDDLSDDGDFRRFNELRSVSRIPGGELMAEAQLRMVSGLEKLREKHPNETVAVVSHADLIKAAIAYYAGIHLDMFQRLEISTASVSIVERGDDAIRIALINHTGGIKF